MDPQNKNEMKPEMRLMIASVLSVIVILVFSRWFMPKVPPAPPKTNQAGVTAPNSTAAPATGTNEPKGNTSATGNSSSGAPVTLGAATNLPPVADSQEKTVVVQSNLYRVEFTNRGAVVRSWLLLKYMDDAKPPQVLDIVHKKASQEVGSWPFGLVLDDADNETLANTGLYKVECKAGCTGDPSAAPLKAPADLLFTWGNGHLQVSKEFRFDQTYVLETQTSVTLDGKPVTAGLGWLGGFGDLTVANPAPVETVNVFSAESGKLTTLP